MRPGKRRPIDLDQPRSVEVPDAIYVIVANKNYRARDKSDSGFTFAHPGKYWSNQKRESKMPSLLRTLAGLLFCVVVSSAWAQHWGGVQGKVTLIEPSNVGTISGAAVYFMIDVNAPTCPAGSWLFWAPRTFGGSTSDPNEVQKQLANTRAALSTLQLALATGTKVTLSGYNAVSGYCQIASIWSQP